MLCAETSKFSRFLRLTPGLSRQVIGELLGENNERCIRVLDLFTASFDFKGMLQGHGCLMCKSTPSIAP